MSLKLLTTDIGSEFDPSEEDWTISTPSSDDFETPRTSLTTDDTTRPIHPDHEVLEGIYCILNVVDLDCSLDLSGYDNESVIAYGANGGDNQLWRILPLGPGYSIQAVAPAKYLTLKDGIKAEGRLKGSAYPVSWVIEKGRDSWRIRWPESDFVIDAPGGGRGHKIQLLRSPVDTGTPPTSTGWLLAPQFDDEPDTTLKKIDSLGVSSLSSSSGQILLDGTYYIRNSGIPNCCLDFSLTDKQSILVWESNPGDNQKWKITHKGHGFYSISIVKPLKYVDLKDGVKPEGKLKGSDKAVNWIIEESIQEGGEGIYYSFRWPDSDLVIGSSGNLRPVQLFKAPTGTGPKPSHLNWVLIPVEAKPQ